MQRIIVVALPDAKKAIKSTNIKAQSACINLRCIEYVSTIRNVYEKKGNINITFPLFVTESHSIYPKILFIKSGGNILLNCSENSGQSVIWRHNKDIYAVGSNVNKNFVQDGKITLTGNHDNGEYNLKVLNVGKTDEGTYWCTSSNGDDVIDLAIDVQIMSTYTSSINYVSYKNKIITSQKQQMKSCKDDVKMM